MAHIPSAFRRWVNARLIELGIIDAAGDATSPVAMTAANISALDTGTPVTDDLGVYVEVIQEVAATMGPITVSGVGTPDSEITIGGKTYTVVASGATGDQINAGATATAFATNIENKVDTDTATTLCTVTRDTADLTFTANTPGAAGNDIIVASDDPAFVVTAFTGGVTASETLKNFVYP